MAIGCTSTWLPFGSTCTDGDPCTGPEECMMKAGTYQCIPLSTSPCDDFNSCTNDSCDPVKGCLYVNLAGGAACTDSNVCTTTDLCTVNGSTVTCSGSGMTSCADSNVCTLDFCHQAVGCLFKDASCNDHNPCTIDACGGSGCTNTFSAAACPVLALPFNDAVACTDTQWTLTPGIKGASSSTTAVWAIDATPMPPVPYTGSCTLNFNDGTGYVGSHWGRAVSNGTFSAVGKSKVTLTFWSYGDVSPDNAKDVRKVEVSVDGFKTIAVTAALANSSGQKLWQQVTVDLAAVANKVFQVRFAFDTAVINHVAYRKGWFVDDVGVSAQ